LDERKKKDTLNKSDTIRIIGRAKVDFTSDSKKFYERYWKEGTIVSEATFQRYQAILKEFFTDEIKGKHILEIGVGGEGGIIYYLKDGNEVYGIDASLSAEKNCKRLGLDIQIVNVDKEGIPFSDGFFDVIFAFEVAEHFANPQFAFEEIRRVLKDDGILLLSTPNPLIHHWPRLFYPDLFEKKAFEEFLMINGFQIIKKSGSGVNIHQHILRSEDSRAWMWFWNCRKVSSDRSGVFMDYGKYFWRQKNEFGIRTRPIEAIDMFRISCQKNNNNLEARFYLTWALLYRYIYGETEEFLQNLVILFDIAGTAKYPFNMQAVCQILLIYLEAKILGVEVFRHDLFVDLVQRYFCFQDSKLYIENLNKMNNDFDMEAFLYLIY
jgi:SAM-dependent methyltransferase